jgi:hypothetical protein
VLQIREQQLALMAANTRERFVQELATFLRETLPASVARLTGGELMLRIRLAVIRAEEYGLKRRVDIRGFVGLDLGIGPAFDRHPAVQAVMREERIPAAKKIDYLIERVRPEEWQEAQRIPVGDNETGV